MNCVFHYNYGPIFIGVQSRLQRDLDTIKQGLSKYTDKTKYPDKFK